MIGIVYWDCRLHRWGAWLATGAGRLSATPIARMRALGVRIQADVEGDAPMVHEIERETDEMVRRLPRVVGGSLAAHYRDQVGVDELAAIDEVHPDTVRRRIRAAQKKLQQMLDERRRGLKPERVRAVSIPGQTKRGRGRMLASVVPETIS